MLDRLLAPAWPPIVAIVAAVAVFFGILLTTPPGLQSFRDLLGQGADDARALAGAYALGAASFFSLLTLVGVALLLALAAAVFDYVRKRDRTKGQQGPS